MKRAWLELFDWELVIATKAALCQPKKALHQPTRDGYTKARAWREKRHGREMFLDEAVDLCRQCHRLAPFCNFNGNTFAAIARNLVDEIKLPADELHVIRSLAGHIVARTATGVEAGQFLKFSRGLTVDQLKKG